MTQPSKKKILNLILHPFVFTFFGALIGVFVKSLILDQNKAELPFWLIIILLTAFILAMSLIYLKIKDILNRINLLHHHNDANLQFIDTSEEAMLKLIGAISDAEQIRIIGTGRQDVVERMRDKNKIVKKYLGQLEKRIRLKKYLVFKRITSDSINPSFLTHLETCLEYGVKNNHEVGISLVDDIEIAMTYVIVDDRIVVFNLYNKYSEEVSDSSLDFFSTNKLIIRQFIEHFEGYWSKDSIKSRINKSGSDLRQNLRQSTKSYVKKNVLEIGDLTKCMNSLKQSSGQFEHLRIYANNSQNVLFAFNNTNIIIKKCELIIRYDSTEELAGYNQSVKSNLLEWKRLEREGRIGNLIYKIYEHPPSEWQMIFDQKYCISGLNNPVSKDWKGIDISNECVLISDKLEDSQALINSYVLRFDQLFPVCKEINII